MKKVHQKLLLQFGGILRGAEKEGSQQNAIKSQDGILAVYDDGMMGAEFVLTDPKPVGEGDAVSVQHIQTEEKPNYWTKTVWGWVKSI